MARPRSFETSEALQRAKDVFWRRGFEATSYADLMAATGLGKASLYAAFGDKQTLYHHVITSYLAREIEAVLDLLGAGRNAYEKVLGFLLAAIATDAARGCLLCNAAVESEPGDDGTRALVKSGMQRLEDALILALACGASPTERHRREARGLLATYLGLRVLAKSGMPRAVLAEICARSVANLRPEDLH